MEKHADIYDLFKKVYAKNEEILQFLLPHSESVAKLAVKIAKKQEKKGIDIDINFVERAALLHDIGILKTHAPEIKCLGSAPYIQHGIFGRDILIENGFLAEATVAQNHIGVGLSAKYIKAKNLPLPHIDMLPVSIEEKIVAYADLFFSKNPKRGDAEKTLEEVKKSVKKYGDDAYQTFKKWRKRFT